MQLSTPVILPETDVTLDVDSRVMMVGSCFAENVGEKLAMYMGEDKVDVNPFGVLYNPVSIAQGLSYLIHPSSFNPSSFIFLGQDGVWHSWMHTSHFSGQTKEECLNKVEERLAKSRENLKKANLLCVTFGTTRCYSLKSVDNYVNEHNIVVANCHKEPQRCFTETEPTLEELITMWHDVIKNLREYNPTLRICFTVSPYRYKKYGFHESQIQKAKLLLLIDALCYNKFSSKVYYFPVYEIMMDELRDYRFYANDMLHPSDLAVDIIADRFMDWTFTTELKNLSMQNLKNYKRSQHRQIT